MQARLLVGTRKGLFILRPGPDADRLWEVEGIHFLGEPVSMVLADPRNGRLHAALNLGHFGVKMRRSDDGGRSWQEAAVPLYPPQPESATSATSAPWSLTQTWSLEAGGADQPGGLWAGTIPGGLFFSDDGGDSWALVRSLWDRPERAQWFGGGYDHPGIHSICVDPRDSRRLTIAVSSGGVWQSADDGASWQARTAGMWADYVPEELSEDPNVQDPHRMVQCRAQPETLWLQHHCGIWRSRDGAASWQRIVATPSSFGFAVVVHPMRPDTAWFVPAVQDACRVPVDARLVVTRTRDGGASFEQLGEGLPQEPSYDLIYRHGLAIDPSGEMLAMGSTTGSLWVGGHGGAAWQCVSRHLPPINCVLFGHF